MADQQDLNVGGDRSGRKDPDLPIDRSGPGEAPSAEWDRAIFTSLPSPTGEGYRFVAWSPSVRLEERQELTRRAPSHGSLAGDGAISRGLLHLQLQSTGRSGWGFVRVAGAEHTRRGGGRVWTDFLLRDAADVARDAVHPDALRTALAAEPPPKQPIGSVALPRVGVSPRSVVEPSARDPRHAARAATVAGLLAGGRACVAAVGAEPASVFEDAMHMLPAWLRSSVNASAGLRFSPSRGVTTTVTDRIDQDAMRATRGHGVECIDVESKPPAPPASLAPWLELMARWWSEGRAPEAAALSARVGKGWKAEDLPRIATVADSVVRGEMSVEALDDFLASR